MGRFCNHSTRHATNLGKLVRSQVERRTQSNEAPNPHITAPEAYRVRTISARTLKVMIANMRSAAADVGPDGQLLQHTGKPSSRSAYFPKLLVLLADASIVSGNTAMAKCPRRLGSRRPKLNGRIDHPVGVNDLKVIDDAFCFLFGLVGLERVQEDNFDAAIIIEDDKGNLVEDLPHVLLGDPWREHRSRSLAR